MSPRRLLWAIVLCGCYTSGQPDAPVDVGPVDAPRGMCDPVGSMPACGPGCGLSAPCEDPNRELNCSPIDDGLRPTVSLCVADWALPVGPDGPYPFYCDLPGERPGTSRMFSHRGDHACWFTTGGLAASIAETDCDAVTAAFGDRCRWTDGSTRTRTPPPVHTSCPAAPRPGSVLCGGPCGHCEVTFLHGMDHLTFPCVGRNDERDLGVCGVGIRGTPGCSPEAPASSGCPDPFYLGVDYPETREGSVDLGECVCLSFRRADGFEAAGWPVPRSNCTTYRELYPGEVECYDDTWTPLP